MPRDNLRCGDDTAASPNDPDISVRNDSDELDQIRLRLESAENAGDADAMVAVLAEDAVLMVPQSPVLDGREACAAFVRDVLPQLTERFDRRVRYDSDEVRVIGDIAFDRGTFAFTCVQRSDGDTSQTQGKYFWLYMRPAGGSWKLARTIMSLDEADEPGAGSLPGPGEAAAGSPAPGSQVTLGPVPGEHGPRDALA